MNPRIRFSPRIGLIALTLVSATLAGTSPCRAAGGPTPFPDPKDEVAWPGRGPIRVFPWMVDNRNYFWSRRNTDQDTVVFVGDSLTGNWKLANMKAALPDLNVANRGIGGDVTRGVLFRLREDVLDLNPRAMVLLIGANDMSAHAPEQAIVDNITQIIEQAREFNKDLPIVLCLLTPRASDTAPVDQGKLKEVNTMLTSLGSSYKNLAVVDLFTAMATPEGGPDPKYFQKDLLHLGPVGYEKWTEVLKPAFTSLNIK